MELDELLNKNQKEAATYLDSHLRMIAGDRIWKNMGGNVFELADSIDGNRC